MQKHTSLYGILKTLTNAKIATTIKVTIGGRLFYAVQLKNDQIIVPFDGFYWICEKSEYIVLERGAK